MVTLQSCLLGSVVTRLLNIPCLASAPQRYGLSPSLSGGVDVYLPGTEGFANATLRWSAAAQPDIDIVIKVRTEEDVQDTIRYANEQGKPFLAISGSHGQAMSLKNVSKGVGIWMRAMNSVEIVDGGRAAIVGGGIENGELIRALWAQGKQTSTTACDCAGFVAPVFGGGHGWLQGRYGLPADQLISARLVIANGSAITVSQNENEDLFWAIRGAGHNYGIATELKIKIYDRAPGQDQWTGAGFTFTHDKLGSVFDIGNKWLEQPERPVELTHYATFSFDATIDPVRAIFTFWIFYQNRTIPVLYTDELYALEPVGITSKVTDLAGMNTHLAAAYGMAACEKGRSQLQYPVSLNRWPLSNLKEALDIFSELPSDFKNSVVLLEAYATNRVNEIPVESTAFADRRSQLLVSPLITYAADPTLDAIGFSYGAKIRQALLDGTGERLHAYVNYAHGDESLQAVYGYEPWRLEKLRKLKKIYDPFGSFNFFSPLS